VPLREHFGIEPRHPGRLVVLASAVLLLGLLALLMLVLSLAGEFGLHAPRLFYYLWLAGLIVVGVMLARLPTLAAFPLVVAAIDLGLGVGSLALDRAGAGVVSVMPPQFHPASGFQWHPLLQAVPIRSLPGGVPGLEINHSSAGTRGREHAAAELERKTVLAVFGGSTTYDVAVTDGQTWTDRLEQRLGTDRWAVINHGVPGYSTAEHLLQTAFYANAFGRRPDCALYYVGWNDIRNAGIADLDSAYARRHLRSQIDSLRVRRIGSNFYTPSPVLTVAIRLLAIAADTVRPAEPSSGKLLDRPDPRFEELFLRNVAAISAINRGRGTRSLWAGQLLNRAILIGDQPSGWVPLIRNRDLWPFQDRLNGLLRRQAESQGDVFVETPIDGFTKSDFVDSGHLSAAGAAKFAATLAPQVLQACR
jgi:lysophospholipase L1-like esterase